MLLEVCVDSVESSKNAVAAGANRLEICGALGIGGGLTPSLGLVQCIKASISDYDVDCMVMIRPRAGDFCYTEDEMQVMLQDIQNFKTSGITGFVFGVLTLESEIDVEHTTRLVQAASPLNVTFHRAFDLVPDLVRALNDVSKIRGVQRILTSGGGPKAPSSVDTLRALYAEKERIKSPIIIMPGSGINALTLQPLLDSLAPYEVNEVHLSGGTWHEGRIKPETRKKGMGMSSDITTEWQIWQTSFEAVSKVRDICNNNKRSTPGRVDDI
ncbi:hypothetical protein SISSUDRAFT_1125449 [Sistotremastrum suecicum HHB10207 ss-3]|uniref:Copper homeostasis protein cutC homolog n=1 Tax=Sistotremastrum suecicum HHB10207 ss-3 TaxID=1314776 RepID=A0A166HCU6_9AGAM|nr:hypothetical protein SISSUDRAFT_1125449 [Sistotremastrum suecicum HHB10207 ss-3]